MHDQKSRSYDLPVELWNSVGLGPKFEHPSHAGFGLDATAKANGLTGKTGHGALAPVQWQSGQRRQVVDCCLEDTGQTKGLVDEVLRSGALVDPSPQRSAC